MESTTWEIQRKERRKLKKNEARTRKKREERQAKKEKRLQEVQASAAVHPKAGSSASASVDDQPGTSTTKDTVQGKGNKTPTKFRGPLAKRARREGEDGLGGPQRQPDPSTQAERKRTRGEKMTPPERERKKVKRTQPTPPARASPHVSPLLRKGTKATSRGEEAGRPTTNRENQVVILSSREDGVITPTEEERLRGNLVLVVPELWPGRTGLIEITEKWSKFLHT
ncbi:hypothetical protein NQ315_016608 [Exocentrus adspersus]|uniref:Uncharacterized protein n=1 Tax=Exocentrus adspersus TaxID=1586481 RepID=A0AAV8VNN9_9CUCU|nr:hypothetical protein NQ315_016608 [Exocentrus adspersus]